MPTLPLHMAPSLLVLFMMTLALVPLIVVWIDDTRRSLGALELEKQRQAARLNAALAQHARADANAARPMAPVPRA